MAKTAAMTQVGRQSSAGPCLLRLRRNVGLASGHLPSPHALLARPPRPACQAARGHPRRCCRVPSGRNLPSSIPTNTPRLPLPPESQPAARIPRGQAGPRPPRPPRRPVVVARPTVAPGTKPRVGRKAKPVAPSPRPTAPNPREQHTRAPPTGLRCDLCRKHVGPRLPFELGAPREASVGAGSAGRSPRYSRLWRSPPCWPMPGSNTESRMSMR